MTSDVHREAQNEARRLIGQLVDLLEKGEHLGAPSRTDHRIVIPIEQSPFAEGADDAEDADDASVRALLAAWLDHPPPAD